MQMNTYLSFKGNCEAAFRFYEQCLGAQIGTIFRYAGTPLATNVPADWSDKVMHGTLTIGGQVLMAGDVAPDQYEEPKGFSLSLHTDNAADAERMFRETGCAAVSIGRGSLSNPFLFRQLDRWAETGDPGPEPTFSERVDVMERHFRGLVERRGESIDDSLARLTDLRLPRGASGEQLLDAVLAGLSPAAEDDVALLAATLRGKGGKCFVRSTAGDSPVQFASR